ncbi:alpha/beta fold hydrolase [Nocardioides acrostichi]|uniref:Alpha/beta fold hydrolase n=1 Tax=Nocardioides acrostichi TaxID=2784339 RepID=A0A930V1G8_9ACTN|nr:alpha/beta fold hydrolase [Nocardioides acrostichi]MBF4162940.1 alpha/beta fold hydrolase [Nocardioides acrostichi]
MREEPLRQIDPPAAGVRCVPERPGGAGVLVVAGSSGRIDVGRVWLLAAQGVLAESVRWFGGEGQSPGPYDVPIELFLARVAALRARCDRVVLVGLSFGAEAVLLTAAHADGAVDAVAAFAPSDVAWAGVRPDGTQTSHWSIGGTPVPFVPFAEDWEPDDDPPSYAGMYRRAREVAPQRVAAAAIAVERIPTLLCVAGGDDRVWPAVEHAEAIRHRRALHGLATTVVTDAEAGHRTVLPGEAVVAGGQRMARGGTETADRRLGERAWRELQVLLGV